MRLLVVGLSGENHTRRLSESRGEHTRRSHDECSVFTFLMIVRLAAKPVTPKKKKDDSDSDSDE